MLVSDPVRADFNPSGVLPSFGGLIEEQGHGRTLNSVDQSRFSGPFVLPRALVRYKARNAHTQRMTPLLCGSSLA